MPSKEIEKKSKLSSEIDSFFYKKKTERAAASGKDACDVKLLNIIEYINRFKLLPLGLFPTQEFIVKLYYNIQLDDKEKKIKITDKFGDKVIANLTEKEYLEYLYDNGRCNIREQDSNERKELILVLGRRSGKCVSGDSLILTNDGVVEIGSICDKSGPKWQDCDIIISQEGINKTSKAEKVYNGGFKDYKVVKTSFGYSISATNEHRLKVLNTSTSTIEWKYVSDIQESDIICIHKNTNLWSTSYRYDGNMIFDESVAYRIGSGFSHDSDIPDFVMTSPKSVFLSFFNGLLKSNNFSGKSIDLNYNACRKLQVLLANASVISKISGNSLSIVDIDSIRKLKEYGLHIDQTDHEFIQLPGCVKNLLVRYIESSKVIDKGKVLEYVNYDRINSSMIESVLNIVSYYSDDISTHEKLDAIRKSDYFYDKVTSVSDDSGLVFDLNVPDGSQFVCQSFTNHNSEMSSIFASYELYKLLSRGNPQSYYGMPNSSEIRIMCVANDKEQASIVFGNIQGHVENVDYFKSSVANTTQTFMKFKTEFDKSKRDGEPKPSITATFKSSIAKGLRGRGAICAILDEIAFFTNKGKSSADQVYKAIAPALAQFSPKDPKNKHIPIGPTDGRIVMISSPDSKEGFFYNQYMKAMSGGPGSKNTLVIQAPTWEVNPTISKEYYETEFHKDPNAFMVEHGAQFSDRVRGWIENHDDLFDCIDYTLKPKTQGGPREIHFLGLDFALSNDGTAICLMKFNDGKLELVYHEVWYPKKSWKESNPHLVTPFLNYCHTLADVSRLDIDKIIEWISIVCKKFYVHSGIFDQWSSEVIEQALHKNGLTQLEKKYFTTQMSSDMYMNVKMLMYNKQLRLYDYPVTTVGDSITCRSPFIKELLELQASRISKNMISVEAPSIDGKHDDMSDAFARSIFAATQYLKLNPDAFERGSSSGKTIFGLGNEYTSYHRKRNNLHGVQKYKLGNFNTGWMRKL